MELYPLVLGLGLAIGVGLLVHALLSFIFAMGKKLLRFTQRGRLHVLGLNQGESVQGKQTQDAVLGLDHIPWPSLYAAAAFSGLLLLLTLGPLLPGFRLGFLALPGLIWLAKRYLIQQRKRFMPGQIRQFLLDVRLHMSLQGSLLLGLESIARTTLETSAVYRCLQKRMQGSVARSGLDVLNQLADELKTDSLLRVVQRVQAAQQTGGVADVDQAIASVIDELNEEISYQSEEEMQRLPLRITLLAMPFLLGPIVILLFYPLVDRILKTLSGVSIGGGF
ncbi:MAG: hypothetical protein JEZ00_11220 [Anaerolineaceae bacterium]|nr:hypothetical protein [Anaerolineaceae bacterium]